jgi:nucleosome binding factor SPN SPT16 subunit
MALTINTQLFEGRLKALCESLGGQSALWGNAVALAVVTGPSLDEIRYHKSIALHHWLFGCVPPFTSITSNRPVGQKSRRAWLPTTAFATSDTLSVIGEPLAQLAELT